MDKKPLKTFNMKFFDDETKMSFREFQKTCVYKGRTATEVLISLALGWLSKNKPNIRLMSESELLRAIDHEGLLSNKAILVKYRKGGYLQNGKVKWWWTNDDGRIVYDADKTLEFLRARAGAKSRIAKTQV